MSLDVTLYAVAACPHCGGAVSTEREVYSANITHNLNRMAMAAGIYEACWRPDEDGMPLARDLIEPLRKGLADLKARPDYFQQFNAPNGWGVYFNFVPWVEEYLAACEASPNARVEVSR